MADQTDMLLNSLRAVAEPTRLRLFVLLAKSELTVSELQHILGQSQPRVSRHLKLLGEAGLVNRHSEGTWAFFRLAQTPSAQALAEYVRDALADGSAVAARDQQRLDDIKQQRAKRAADYFRRNAQHWDSLRDLHISDARVEKELAQLLGKSPIGQLVDVGTGTGRMLELLADRYDQGIGVDLSRDMLQVARANLDKAGIGKAHLRQGDMYALDLPDNSADVVLFHQVLHYADEPQRAVGEAARLLGPRGRLIIVDFAPHGHEELRSEHAHRRLGFSDEEVSGWCSAAGLALAKTKSLPSPRGADGLTINLWCARRGGKVS